MGEAAFTLYERTTIRPALTFNGCRGGYGGEGGKAVIPKRASAKLNLRLVPDEDPDQIEGLVRAHVAARIRRASPSMCASGSWRGRSSSITVTPRSPPPPPYRDGFGRDPVLLRSGGTLPVASVFQHVLGLPVLMMGFALPDDRMHGPDERFSLTHFHRGIATSVSLLARLPAALRRTRMASVAGGNGHSSWPVAATP